jgi:hypothetical protein
MILEFLPQNLVILAHFFSQNSLTRVALDFFLGFQATKICQERKNVGCHLLQLCKLNLRDIKSINILFTSKLNLNFLLYLQVP